MNNSDIKKVYVSGNSQERGYQYGVQCRELIGKSIDTYFRLASEQRRGVSMDQLRSEFVPLLESIKKYDKKYYLEIQAIAQGSGFQLNDIGIINCRAEIINPIWKYAKHSEGCTSFYIGKTRTCNQHAYLGQTWDWSGICENLLVMVHSKDEGGHQFFSITEAGSMAKIGVNNKGIANLLNYLHNIDGNASGTPYNILLHRIIDSEDFVDAQRNIMRSPIAYGLNTFIADRFGSVVDYELTPNGIDFFHPQDDLLIHTNHYISEKLLIRTYRKDILKNSYARYQTASEVLGCGLLSHIDILSFFSQHDTVVPERSICRHSDIEIETRTLFCILVDLTEFSFYYCIGNPCQHSFQRVNLMQLFESDVSIL